MFTTGNILHIDKYIFREGKTKDTGKFLIVLYNNENISIVATLTSSKDYVPIHLRIGGCIKDPDTPFNAYFIPKRKEICTNKYSFKKDTFIYFNANIFDQDIKYYENAYNDGAIKIVGSLNNNELNELVYCIYNSEFTKRKIKRLLEKLLEELNS